MQSRPNRHNGLQHLKCERAPTAPQRKWKVELLGLFFSFSLCLFSLLAGLERSERDEKNSCRAGEVLHCEQYERKYEKHEQQGTQMTVSGSSTSSQTE